MSAASDLFGQRPDGRACAKICGITNPDDARAVVAAGADALGINFWPKSKRYISLEDARPWLAEIEVPRIGVFVDAGIERPVERFATTAVLAGTIGVEKDQIGRVVADCRQ